MGNKPGYTGHFERLRDRFEKGGLEAFGEYEIVELLLTFGTPRCDCKPIARAAIEEFKSLRGVLDAPEEELSKIKGINKRNIVYLKIIRATANELLKDKAKGSGVYCNSAEDVYNHLKVSISAKPQEVFKVFYLDNRNQVRDIEDLFTGTVNRSAVYPREVMNRALKHNATGLIFAHNHPSGCLEPSPEDKNLTRTLVFAAIFMQIKVLDHLIITRDGYYSFSASGLIDQWEAEYIKLNMAQ